MSGEANCQYEEVKSKCSELSFICENFAPEMHLDDIINSFRLFRNLCTLGANYQNFVAKQGLECVEKVLLLLVNRSDVSENVRIAIRVGMQVLGNMVVGNNETQILVWKKCAYLLSDVLYNEDERTANCAAMVVHNIILGLSQEELVGHMDIKLVKGLLSSACNGSEFGHFAVESLLAIPNWLVEYYSALASHEKYYVLDLMCEHISKPSNSNSESKKEIHHSAIKFISAEFCARSDKILDTRMHSETLESDSQITELSESTNPCEYTKLLEVLASAASIEAYRPVLQSDGPLLVHTVYLLKSIHAVGKLAEEKGDFNHPFAPIKSLSKVESSGSCGREALELHPAYGFKGNLIRLIGNLSWKNKEIQDKILELECVPLILDSCNIDERNPFITQWAILTIRNLCDGNLHVQEVIAGLKREGVINCDLLNEMGLALHDPGDPAQKISIVPLPR